VGGEEGGKSRMRKSGIKKYVWVPSQGDVKLEAGRGIGYASSINFIRINLLEIQGGVEDSALTPHPKQSL
jgi:hypothetical protein